MAPSRRAKAGPLSPVLVGTAVLSALAFWRPSLDFFGYPKFAVLVFGVAVAGAIAAHGAVVSGRLNVPWGLPACAAGGFGLIVLVAFLLDPSVFAFIGAYSRHTGALFYLSLVLAALLMLRAAGGGSAERWTTTRSLAVGVVAVGAILAAIGLLQLAGTDPLGRSEATDIVTATFGNTNFAAALIGLTVPVGAWAAWERTHGSALRAMGGFTVVAGLVTAVGTRSVQGPVTAAVGLLVFALAVILGMDEQRVRRAAIAAWTVVTVIGGAIGAASLVGRGPFGGLAGEANVDLRSFYWSAGVRMFTDNPLTGVGLERYGAYFGDFRSEAAARRLDANFAVDAAHSVPIQLFATGGFFVGLAYLAFVALTAVALVRAFRRTTGRERLLVGALGAIWASYQTQSVISIDVPPLALLHWLSAAAIIAWSGMVELRPVELPWFSSRRKADIRRRRDVSAAVLSVALIVLFILVLFPLQASTAAARGAALANAERYSAAVDELEQATSKAPWEPAYWEQLGDIALRAGRQDQAMGAYLEAMDREPRSIVALVTAARIADAEEDAEHAAELYRRALEVEPLAPTVLKEAATFFDEHGDEVRAEELRERARRVTG